MAPLDDLIHLSFWGTTDLDQWHWLLINSPQRGAQSNRKNYSNMNMNTVMDHGAVYYVLSGNLIYGFSVYYRAYDDNGEIVSKTSFDENNPSLGRVITLSAPPPHTVSSLKNRIIIFEDLSGHEVQLFEDEGSESAMNDSDALTFISDTFPGYTEERPVAITYQ